MIVLLSTFAGVIIGAAIGRWRFNRRKVLTFGLDGWEWVSRSERLRQLRAQARARRWPEKV
jgi:hypothetical protein